MHAIYNPPKTPQSLGQRQIYDDRSEKAKINGELITLARRIRSTTELSRRSELEHELAVIEKRDEGKLNSQVLMRNKKGQSQSNVSNRYSLHDTQVEEESETSNSSSSSDTNSDSTLSKNLTNKYNLKDNTPRISKMMSVLPNQTQPQPEMSGKPVNTCNIPRQSTFNNVVKKNQVRQNNKSQVIDDRYEKAQYNGKLLNLAISDMKN